MFSPASKQGTSEKDIADNAPTMAIADKPTETTFSIGSNNNWFINNIPEKYMIKYPTYLLINDVIKGGIICRFVFYLDLKLFRYVSLIESGELGRFDG